MRSWQEEASTFTTITRKQDAARSFTSKATRFPNQIKLKLLSVIIIIIIIIVWAGDVDGHLEGPARTDRRLAVVAFLVFAFFFMFMVLPVLSVWVGCNG